MALDLGSNVTLSAWSESCATCSLAPHGVPSADQTLQPHRLSAPLSESHTKHLKPQQNALGDTNCTF
eukprot:2645692-Rhodomonas_salina.1